MLKALAALALLVSTPSVPQTVNPTVVLDAPVGVPAPALPKGYDPRTVNDGLPPVRFEGAATLIVSFGTVFECGQAPPGYHFGACVRSGIVHMPNPCEYTDQSYARHMCHELGHANGWTATHGG